MHEKATKTAEVYYFSGTGNSFAAAREIAIGLGGDLLSIPVVVRKQRSLQLPLRSILNGIFRCDSFRFVSACSWEV